MRPIPRLTRTALIASVSLAAMALASPAEAGIMGSTTFTYTDTLLQETVITPGLYDITAYGADGGSADGTPGGRGAALGGEFGLTANETLSILVGHIGGSGSGGGGGGGGSFVASGTGAAATPLLIAGGGGGAGFLGVDNNGPVMNATTTAAGSSGASGYRGVGGAPGTGGAGGAGGTGSNSFGGISLSGGGGGGGGLNGNGGNGGAYGGSGGSGFSGGGLGGAGGKGGAHVIFNGGNGGFGGGGGGGFYGGGGGGGGLFDGGGGGGSFLEAGITPLTLTADYNNLALGGNGEIVFTYLGPAPTTSVPEPPTLPLLATALLPLALAIRRPKSR